MLRQQVAWTRQYRDFNIRKVNFVKPDGTVHSCMFQYSLKGLRNQWRGECDSLAFAKRQAVTAFSYIPCHSDGSYMTKTELLARQGRGRLLKG